MPSETTQPPQCPTWRTETYPSGTCIVTSHEAGTPWLYVYGPKPVGPKDEEGDDVQATRNRYQMCDELAAFLNGGPHPAWLDDLRRTSETQMVGDDGSQVFTVPPTRPEPSDSCGWVYRDDQEAKDAQSRLVDRLGAKGATR